MFVLVSLWCIFLNCMVTSWLGHCRTHWKFYVHEGLKSGVGVSSPWWMGGEGFCSSHLRNSTRPLHSGIEAEVGAGVGLTVLFANCSLSSWSASRFRPPACTLPDAPETGDPPPIQVPPENTLFSTCSTSTFTGDDMADGWPGLPACHFQSLLFFLPLPTGDHGRVDISYKLHTWHKKKRALDILHIIFKWRNRKKKSFTKINL